LQKLEKGDFKTAAEVKGIDLVATIAAFKDTPLQTKLTAAIALALHQEIKPTEKVDPELASLGEPTDAHEALAQMSKIIQSATAGKTGLDAAQKLLSMRETLIDGHVGVNVMAELDTIRAEMDELRAKAAKLIEAQTEISGGLPDLDMGVDKDGEPLAGIIMPKFKKVDP
jgi:hypothetical protein